MLPQTSASATYHSLRVYVQVEQWMGRDHMNPEDWCWYGQGAHYFPNLTDKDPATTDLLEMVRSNCKAWCNTQRCTYRKHGFQCSTAVWCAAMLTIFWMMKTTYMMTRSKWQFCDSLKFSLLHSCGVCSWLGVYVCVCGELCMTDW